MASCAGKRQLTFSLTILITPILDKQEFNLQRPRLGVWGGASVFGGWLEEGVEGTGDRIRGWGTW